MSDIQTMDELKDILEMKRPQHKLEIRSRERKTTKTINMTNEIKKSVSNIEKVNDIRRRDVIQTENPLVVQPIQNSQRVEIIDDKSLIIKIPNLNLTRQQHPLPSPTGSIISISSSSDDSKPDDSEYEVDIED